MNQDWIMKFNMRTCKKEGGVKRTSSEGKSVWEKVWENISLSYAPQAFNGGFQ